MTTLQDVMGVVDAFVKASLAEYRKQEAPREDLISYRQACREFGRGIIDQLTERKLVHRAKASDRAAVKYSRAEILKAATAQRLLPFYDV